MKHTILKQEKNPLLKREELMVEIEADSTPSFKDVLEVLGKEEEIVVCKKIASGFGRNKFVVDVVVYDSKDDREKNEVIPQKIRKKMEEEKKAAEEAKKKEEAEKAAAEEKAKEEAAVQESEEKPAEEVKEEKTEEVKSGEKSE